MNVSLTPELEALVNEKVSSGLYQTASEVVREALRLLKQRDQDRLRADVLSGVRSTGTRGRRRLRQGVESAPRRSSEVGWTSETRQQAIMPYRLSPLAE